MANYYYLLASLPQWTWEDTPSTESLEDAHELIERHIQPGDRGAYRWLLYRNDVRNLIRYWQDQSQVVSLRPWAKPHSLEPEEGKKMLQYPDTAPPFLQEWLESLEGQVPQLGPAELEETVMRLFFEGATTAPHPFLRDYFGFEDELQAVIATYHQGQYDFLDKEPSYLREGLRQQVRKGQGGITESLRLSLPYLESLLEVLATRDAAAIRQKTMKLRWERAEELGRQHFFDLTHLLSYTARLHLFFQKTPARASEEEDPFSLLIQHVLDAQNQTA